MKIRDPIDNHIRNYRSLLKSAGEVKISKLIESHTRMKPLLHQKAGNKSVDIAAFIYVLLRLPSIMSSISTIILGQSLSVFEKNGVAEISKWQEVSSPGRRRKTYFDGKDKLGVYITSVSDVDDVITLLTAFQIEWNKFHTILSHTNDISKKVESIVSTDDLTKIKTIWGAQYVNFLTAIKHRKVDFSVKLLSGSYTQYAKATQQWWDHIVASVPDIDLIKRPIYFISSNMHSIVNILTRFVISEEKTLLSHLKIQEDPNLLTLWSQIENGRLPLFREHFLYYLAKKAAKTDIPFVKRKMLLEQSLGIHTISALHYLDIDAQVIELNKIAGQKLDERLQISTDFLKNSQAVILNIDYPLGWAAYQVLTQLGQNVDQIRGVYIMGKAAALSASVGDIMIPSTVFDAHTKNSYAISNTFSSNDIKSVFKVGSVLVNQKTVTAKGTFLENARMMDGWFRQGYEDIEMEAGPYLNAVYEFTYYNRYEENQFISLTNTPFELGFAHYVSDTPYSKATNLGVRNLSVEGIEPTYAISLAIIKKILEREKLALSIP